MINKLFFNGSKPPTYFIRNKKIKRMYCNGQIVYDRSIEIKFAEKEVVIDTEVIDETYYKLKYNITPENTTEEVTYEISDQNIIKVYAHNTMTKEFWIKTLSMGTCTITARCGGSEDTCTIRVLANGEQEGDENIPCTKITCDAEVTVDNENILPENGGGQLINVTVEPVNTTDVVTCTVHNPNMIYVKCIDGKWYVFSNGINQSGATVITFKCGKCSADCKVTVS